MSDEITITLSRADAGLLSGLAEDGLTEAREWVDNDGLGPVTRAQVAMAVAHGRRIIDALDAALAAPAEGPERAATGELEGLLVAAITDVAETLAAECGDDEKGEAAVRWCLEHSGPRRAEMLNAYLTALRASGEGGGA
jgi:hypothetical protein